MGEIKFQCYEQLDGTVSKPGAPNAPLMSASDIQEGDDILVPGFCGLIQMKTRKQPDGSLCGEAGNMVAVLEFSKDERKAWVSVGLINKNALKKLRVHP